MIAKNITMAKRKEIESLHKLFFEDAGDRNNRKIMRKFNGFKFSDGSEKYKQKTEYITENLKKK